MRMLNSVEGDVGIGGGVHALVGTVLEINVVLELISREFDRAVGCFRCPARLGFFLISSNERLGSEKSSEMVLLEAEECFESC